MEKPRWGDIPNSDFTVYANIRMMRTLPGLDAYGLRLANRHHVWTNRQRSAFEKRVRELKGK